LNLLLIPSSIFSAKERTPRPIRPGKPLDIVIERQTDTGGSFCLLIFCFPGFHTLILYQSFFYVKKNFTKSTLGSQIQSHKRIINITRITNPKRQKRIFSIGFILATPSLAQSPHRPHHLILLELG